MGCVHRIVLCRVEIICVIRLCVVCAVLNPVVLYQNHCVVQYRVASCNFAVEFILCFHPRSEFTITNFYTGRHVNVPNMGLPHFERCQKLSNNETHGKGLQRSHIHPSTTR